MLAEAGIQDTSLHRWIPAFTGNCSCVSSTSAIHGGRSGMTNREIVLVQDLHKFAREMVINTPADEITIFSKRIGIVRKPIQKKYNNITNTD